MNETKGEERSGKADGKRVEFTPPKDFSPPDNVEPGKDWDMVCSFRTKPDGKVCLTKIGDADMPGCGSKEDRDEDGEPKHKPGYGEYVEKLGLSDGMPNGAPAPNSY